MEGVDLATGTRRVLVDRAWAAVVAGRHIDQVVYESDAGLATLEVATGRRVVTAVTGLAPMSAGSMATAGAASPPGTVALAPRGRGSR